MTTTEDAPIILKLNRYCLDMTKPEDAKAHERIRAACKELGYKCFNVLASNQDKDCPHDTVTLEREHVFDNQCNASGWRVFDWYEGIYPNRSIKRGYYLTGDVDRLRELRTRTYRCGYCGSQHIGHDAPICCTKCLGSEYLKPKDLPLLVMQPLIGPRRTAEGPALAEYEAAQTATRAAYEAAQGGRREAKALKIIEEAKEKAASEMYEANTRAAVLRAGFDVDNLIYYSHTKKWVWGWRNPCSQEESERIRSAEWPFDYTIKMQDGTAR